MPAKNFYLARPMPFFNKIRKNEIKTEGMKRYLLYAIGEILLVMIGILLALEVSNQNENGKENQLNDKLLGVLIADLKARNAGDKIDLNGSREIFSASDPIMATWNEKRQIDTTNLQIVLRWMGGDGWFFTPLSPAYNTVVNSTLWNEIPDTLVDQINKVYNIGFGGVKNAFEKSASYGTHFRLNYLLDYDLINTDAKVLDLQKNILKNPQKFITHLDLNRKGVLRVTQNLERSISKVDKLIVKLETF